MTDTISKIEEISRQPLFGVYTFFLGILITIFISYIFYRKSLNEKKFKIIKRTICLIHNFQSQVSKLTVFYDNEKLEKLSITRVVFWNNGKATISNSDIASLEPLSIKTRDELKLIDYKLIQVVEESNKIKVIHEKENNRILIEFEYLDRNHGFIIDIYHNGSNSSEISLSGKFKGCQINEEKYIPTVFTVGKYLSFKRTTMKKILGYFTLIFGLTFLINEMINSKSLVMLIITILLFAFYMYLGYFLLRKRVPKTLCKFEEDIL